MGSTLRTTYALIVPFALLLPVVALDLSTVMIGYGAGRQSVGDFAIALALFAPGLVFFTTHYLMLRGFYALERPARSSGCSAWSPRPTSCSRSR